MEHTLKVKAELLTEHIGDFIETKKDLALINSAIVGTNIASTALFFLVVALFGLIFILFGAIALAICLGNLLENTSLGFLVTGLIFFLVGIICFLLKKKIIIPIKNTIVNLIYDKD